LYRNVILQKTLLSVPWYIALLVCFVTVCSVSVWVRLFQAQLSSQVGEE